MFPAEVSAVRAPGSPHASLRKIFHVPSGRHGAPGPRPSSLVSGFKSCQSFDTPCSARHRSACMRATPKVAAAECGRRIALRPTPLVPTVGKQSAESRASPFGTKTSRTLGAKASRNQRFPYGPRLPNKLKASPFPRGKGFRVDRMPSRPARQGVWDPWQRSALNPSIYILEAGARECRQSVGGPSGPCLLGAVRASRHPVGQGIEVP